jgi:hypothetical protein
MLIELNGIVQVPEPPLWWTGPVTKRDAVSPSRIGYIPYIELDGKEYCARIFNDVILSEGDGWFGVYGRGEAASLELPHRLTRLLRRIRSQFTGLGDRAFTPSTLRDIEIVRAILVFPNKQALLFVDGYVGKWPGAAVWKGPNARISVGAELVVRNVLGAKPVIIEAGIPTSRGMADYYSFAPIDGPSEGCVSAVVCAPCDVNIAVEAQGSAVEILIDDIHLCLNLHVGQIEEQLK